MWNSNGIASKTSIWIKKTNVKGHDIAVRIKIPLNSDRQITIISNSNSHSKKKSTEVDKAERMIIKEVFESPRKAKRCEALLHALIDLINELNQSVKGSVNLIQYMTEISKVFNRIMKNFDLNENAGKLMMRIRS